MIDYKYPRTMDEAFPGHGDYACALEIPRRRHGMATTIAVIVFVVLVVVLTA